MKLINANASTEEFQPLVIAHNENILTRVLNGHRRKEQIIQEEVMSEVSAAQSWSYQVSESEEFSHKEHPQYISKERDESLSRDIISLNSICWLFFRKSLGPHSPGRYRARIRLYVDSRTFWSPSCDPLTMSINKISTVSDSDQLPTRSPIVSENFPPNVWSKIVSGTFQGNQMIVADEMSKNWYFVYLDPFEIQFEEELEWEFKEVSNDWKGRMKLDIIELFLLETFYSGNL